MGQDVRARRLQKADRVNCAKARSDRIELCPESATRYTQRIGAWLSLVERLVRDQEAGGSNPLAPTISSLSIQSFSPLLHQWPSGSSFHHYGQNYGHPDPRARVPWRPAPFAPAD